MNSLIEKIIGKDHLVTSLRLSCIFLFIYGFTDRPDRISSILINCLCALMLINKDFLLNKVLWWFIYVVTLWMSIQYWTLMDNHFFLISYWALACAVSVSVKDSEKSIQFNGRILVGLVFCFAVLWKVFNFQYFDTYFFSHALLTDDRFRVVTHFLGNLSIAEIQQNARLIRELNLFPGPNAIVKIFSNESIQSVAAVLSYWTLFIEGLIGLSFVAAIRFKWFSKWHHWSLIVFLLTTYIFASVPRFAAILAVMGFAQCEEDEKLLKALFLIIALIAQFSLISERLNTLLVPM